MEDPLALELARQARRLDLDALNVDSADEETLRTFTRTVLLELAALVLGPGEEEIGCHAARRMAGH